jgi:hypothetical protein
LVHVGPHRVNRFGGWVGRSESSNGEDHWGQWESSNAGETLWVSFTRHCEAGWTKAVSGAGVKATARRSVEHPRELKAQEGIGGWQWVTPL